MINKQKIEMEGLNRKLQDQYDDLINQKNKEEDCLKIKLNNNKKTLETKYYFEFRKNNLQTSRMFQSCSVKNNSPNSKKKKFKSKYEISKMLKTEGLPIFPLI